MSTGYRPSFPRVVGALALASILTNSCLLAREPRSVTFSKDPKLCVLEWTSTIDGHEHYVYQLYGNGRLESRVYQSPSNSEPTSHSTTDLTPDEFAIWMDDLVDSGLYAYSQSDLDLRIAATGKVRMIVTDTGWALVRVRFQRVTGESSNPAPMSNTFVSDVSWYQSNRYPEIAELATASRMWHRLSVASKAGTVHAPPLAPSPLPILSWTAEERAHAGWTSD